MTGPATDSSSPYVGLRPFEARERHLFFGRDRDGQIVCDKTLSSRLTILYAQSGHGKSSLLRALVIPQLEAEDAVVLYFDAWSQEDPVAGLKAVLAERASELGVPDAGAGGPTVAELVRLLATAGDRTVVLVLDQFEEYLVAHGRRLEPMRAELAALARTRGLDAHVLLSLREEFLAALEPFRHEILDLFRSTYRLEALSPEGLDQAISRPARICGGSCEHALVERLAQDLRAEEVSESAGETVGGSVELPMLQLVCSQLWAAAAADDGKALTLDLYRSLGGAERILARYVRDVMPRRWRRKLFTARLMRPLAPPSGLKMSFSVRDLAENTGLEETRVGRELERLESARILRTRKYGTGTRYELQHDAFIKVVSPWRDDVLARARRRRLLGWSLGGAAAVGVILVGGLQVLHGRERQRLEQETAIARAETATAERDRAQAEASRLSEEAKRIQAERDREKAQREAREKEQRWLQGEALTELRTMPESERARLAPVRFESVASYWIWQRQGDDRWEELARVLRESEDLIPAGYGLRSSGTEMLTWPESDWPLTLEHSSERALDWYYFALDWHSLAQSFGKIWGIPVPLTVRTVERSAFPRSLLRMTGPGGSAEFDAPLYEGRPVRSEAGLDATARELLDHYRHEMQRIPELSHGGPWWVVPRWSLPAWRVTAGELSEGSGITAVLVANQLLKSPDPLLTPPAVELLLERMRRTDEVLVSEALAARGDRLREDLLEIVRRGQPLTGLTQILDALADLHDAPSSAAAAERAIEAVQDPLHRIPDRFGGPWPRSEEGPKPGEASDADAEAAQPLRGYERLFAPDPATPHVEIHPAYREAEGKMPEVPPAIRVYVSGRPARAWLPEESLSDALTGRIESVRDGVYRRFGVEVPGALFRREGWDLSPSGDAFRLLVLNQAAGDEDGTPVPVPDGDGLDAFERELLRRAEVLRAWWITPGNLVWTLGSIDEEVLDWILDHYSITDVKSLLRGVVTPSDAELEERATAAQGAEARVEPGRSIRHTRWLLTSLVFWSLVEDPLDARRIVSRLQGLQAYRVAGAGAARAEGTVAEAIRRGVDALSSDAVDDARGAFAEALAADREAAVEAFQAQWVAYLADLLRAKFRMRAQTPLSSSLGRTERIDLEDLLASWGEGEDPDLRRRFDLMLHVSRSAQPRAEALASLRRILHDRGEPETWPPDEAAGVAMLALRLYDPLRDPAWLVERGSAFLVSAIERMDDQAAFDAYWKVVELKDQRDAQAWLWALLDTLGRARPYGAVPSVPLEQAYQLLGTSHVPELERALDLLAAEARALSDASLSTEELEQRRVIVTCGEAEALATLGAHGDPALLARAEKAYRSLLDTELERWRIAAHVGLGCLLLESGRLDEAEALLRDALVAWPKELQVHQQWLLLQLVRGDRARVAAAAESVLEAVGRSDDGALFLAALGQIVTRSGRWELVGREFVERDHPYRDYIAMLLYAFATGEARQGARDLLLRRWADVASGREDWDRRLRLGDAMAWREMLVGYYVGAVSAEEIFGDIEDPERFGRSGLAQIREGRRGLLCEAYFYDAVLAKARGDEELMRRRLEQCVATGHVQFIEHKVAWYLLGGTTGAGR